MQFRNIRKSVIEMRISQQAVETFNTLDQRDFSEQFSYTNWRMHLSLKKKRSWKKRRQFSLFSKNKHPPKKEETRKRKQQTTKHS